MSLESYLPAGKALYEKWCEQLRVEAEKPGDVGRRNVHCLPFDQFPKPHQLRLAELARDRQAEE